jgi:mono/diheme cytochrome c family protein
MKAATVWTGVWVFGLAAAAMAQPADFIRRDCGSCHAIDADPAAKSPDPKAPRFLDVAKMPSTTELSLKVFLRSSHKNMPNIMLEPAEIDETAAYILGLKK